MTKGCPATHKIKGHSTNLPADSDWFLGGTVTACEVHTPHARKFIFEVLFVQLTYVGTTTTGEATVWIGSPEHASEFALDLRFSLQPVHTISILELHCWYPMYICRDARGNQ